MVRMSVQRIIDLAAIDGERQQLLSRITSIVTNEACSADEKRSAIFDAVSAIIQIAVLNEILGDETP
jgi:hypothetical protein